MKNIYLSNLNKIEFVITNACTGRCRHCSEGDHLSFGEHIDASVASDAVRKISSVYKIETVMTFGGEPLLYPEAVYSIMSTARELGIPKRQVITNGFFNKSKESILSVAKDLEACGVNDLLLSVDAFHQEFIPLEIVKEFAFCAKKAGIPIRLQPAWLVSRSDDNAYNNRTRSILCELLELDIPVGEGNIVFPEGNALKYLSEYFSDSTPVNPYTEDPRDVKCISFSSNGEVLGGNVYTQDIIDIMEK